MQVEADRAAVRDEQRSLVQSLEVQLEQARVRDKPFTHFHRTFKPFTAHSPFIHI